MATFAELTKRVHLINDLILSDMISAKKDYTEESMEFHSRILVTTNWFSRISWVNKKRFVLALLEDVTSVWTLSLLLKSIWNCRPKDAVHSVCQSRIWSSFDQVPLDNNRTALPLSTLKEVMTKDRNWFASLEPESQLIFLSELLMISGGPIMWIVLERAKAIYDTYLQQELKYLQECNVVTEPAPEKVKATPEPPVKKETTPRKSSAGQTDTGKPLLGQAQKELDANLAVWNANIKSMRDRMKLEELEMLFSDGATKKVWKVNRPKPETTETVDFLQLLPSEIGKRILIYLPVTQLGDCARVNKYWSYLVDELKSELLTRQKINVELEKLKDNIMRHGTTLELLTRPELQLSGGSSLDTAMDYARKNKTQTSTRLSAKNDAITFRLANKKDKKLVRLHQPVKNLAELSERLQRRGAADENLWKWCENVLIDNKTICGEESNEKMEGLVPMETTGFPCPLMKHSLNVPLKSPLPNDRTKIALVKSTINMPGEKERDTNLKQAKKRYSLWSKDMSGLYPVCKLPSYQFPF